MTTKSMMALTLFAVCGSGAAHAAGRSPLAAPARSSCQATLSIADARALAAATPNARAFAENLHASLSTEVARENANGNVAVRVVAREPARGPQQVGIYTVNLRSGHVIDDDQEPAEDRETVAMRNRLVAKHCR